MEDLPDDLLIDIFHRLDSAADLATVRLVSKRLCSVSYNVSSISLICSYNRLFLQFRHPDTILPFKSLFKNLVSLFDRRYLVSLSVGFESDCECDGDGNWFDDGDDFWLMDRDYFASLLGGEIASRLISLVVSDFSLHSRKRKSTILELLSTNCTKLLDLDLKNAWLCAKDLKPMLMLRSLTLENIRLDDNDLDKINECLPFLEDLELINVDGIKNPKIQHPTLKTCNWSFFDFFDFAFSLTICAPLLSELRLDCDDVQHVILKTPELHRLEIAIGKHVQVIEVGNFLCLRCLRLKAPVIGKLLQVFSGLTVDSLDVEVVYVTVDTSPEYLIRSFPAATTLRLSPWVLSVLQQSFLHECLSFESLCRSLRTLILHLQELEFEFSVLSFMVSACPLLSDVVFIFPSNTRSGVWNNFTSSFAVKHPGIKWSRQRVSYTEWLC